MTEEKSHFTNPEATSYVKQLTTWLGTPSLSGDHIVGWEKKTLYDPYVRITITDVEDNFITSYSTISPTIEQTYLILKVAPNTLIDLKRGEVGVMSNSLLINDITLSFIEDIINENMLGISDIYEERLKKKIVTQEKYNSYELFSLSKKGGCEILDNNTHECILS